MSVLPVRNSGFESISCSMIITWFDFVVPARPSLVGSPRRGRWHEVQKHLDAAQKIEVVVDLLAGFPGGKPVDELQRADPRFHRVGRHDLGGNFGVVAGRSSHADARRLRVRAGGGERGSEYGCDDRTLLPNDVHVPLPCDRCALPHDESPSFHTSQARSRDAGETCRRRSRRQLDRGPTRSVRLLERLSSRIASQSFTVGSEQPPQIHGKVQSAVSLAVAGCACSRHPR